MNKQIIIDYEEYLVLEHINKIHKNEMNKLRNCVVIPDKEYEQLQQENKELHNKIDKAIEYIEKDTCYDREHTYYDVDVEDILTILEILKDSNVNG